MWFWTERSPRGALHGFIFVPLLVIMTYGVFGSDIGQAIWEPIVNFLDPFIPGWVGALFIFMPIFGLTGALAYFLSKKVAYKIASLFEFKRPFTLEEKWIIGTVILIAYILLIYFF